MFSIISCFLFSCVRQHTLSITTAPRNAVVLLNGIPICYEHPCVQTLEKGQYNIDIRAENYLSHSFTIILDDDKNQEVELKPKGGWISVQSEPTQLPISIDGALVGKSPIKRIPIQHGPHVIDIPDACFETSKVSIEIVSGEEENIFLKPVARMSTVQVSLLNKASKNVDGIVYADGVELGSTQKKYTVPLCTQHIMVIAREGWGQTRTNLLQEPQQAITLDLLPIEEKRFDGLLGFEPPECISGGSVDQKCVQKWFSRVRKRAEERNDHIHHEGCAHE